ncbi:MAG: hypothetical protein Q9181_000983 [Wetmoreana brouardii]
MRVIANSIFRSVDIEFHGSLQRLSRTNEVFKEEVTLAHRQHVEDHIIEQRSSKMAIDRIASRWEQRWSQNDEQETQQGTELRTSIMIWLGQFRSSDSFQRAIKKRSSDTGLWLFDEPLFQRWIQGSDNAHNQHILWVHGAPGIGKTVLSASTIQHIQSHETYNGKVGKVAYFYGDHTKSRDATAFAICVSMLSQLIGSLSDIPSPVLERHQDARRHGRAQVSDDDGVFDLFQEVVAALPSVFLIIDALDECDGISDILSWLEDAVRSSPSLRILCFSRNTAAVRKQLGQQPSVRMDASSSQQDIDKFLSSAVLTLPCEDTELKGRVLETLSRKAEGMFLFVDLSIQMLRAAVDMDDMLGTLDRVPGGINEMYGLILRRLAKESYIRQSLARKVFRLVCASIRPMTWSEMRYALSWDADSQRFLKSKEPFKDTVCELCSPLIEYQTETDTFLLVHFSFREYLCGKPSRYPSMQNICAFVVQEDQAQAELAQITLATMMEHRTPDVVYLNTVSNPLLSYANKYWCRHLSQSSFDEDLYAKYLTFLECPQRRSRWILRWLLTEEYSFPLQQVLKLHKAVQEWAVKGGVARPSMKTILGDIQTALFRLDELRSTSQSIEPSVGIRAISNFERLVCVRDLAREYTMAGELDNGIAIFEAAIRRVESAHGKFVLSSCWLLNSLGILYDQQGKTDLAREVQQRALDLQEKSLPPEHLDIVLTINELGRIARHLGHSEEAESLHRRALQLLESMFAEDDLHITWTKSALGRSLLKQDRPEEAVVLHQQVLAVEVSRLGRDHPHTLWTLSDIVRCQRARGNIVDAIATQQEVMERSKNVLGDDNPDTLWAMNSLGVLHEASGQTEVARMLHTKALEGQARVLGSDHPHTRWSRTTLDDMS